MRRHGASLSIRAGSSVPGSIRAMPCNERYGYIGLFAYDVVQAQNSPQDGSGGTAAAAGASAAVANYLRVLPEKSPPRIVNNLA